ncbi:hypothetical protein [Paraburkholderia nemoris]|uniref:Lipoprotein n=1 Tax=Paraburkholderia nemoris TaxID=2793076 RepID=A0ABM8RAE3_9BURK|nr:MULTISPECIES: hypothetical protein [Paraburkholderia]KPD16462.1 hypothetical protein ADM96_26085 [Burkholderia sp. ST111]MBK5147960.1 hypothetical protein [Burkholderia sp. R-69608]MBK3810908.1 hypothetical protein [Paraburkholderia aspalathi]CAE6741837.1 hypothetical protein R69776_02493 [Paraburkholderia nemoris]CAE6753917.1 hypothetical protein R75777_03111 [Paraburkholderia nemoris]
MKVRILSIACVTTAAALLAACTAVYKNSDACEQLMRSKLAETSSPDTLKITHTGTGIDGSRVVVEGSIEHVMTASEVAAASAASAAKLANAPQPASGVRAASGVSVAQGASSAPAAAAASDVTAGAASGAMAASASVTASGGDAASLKSAKPKKTNTAAAAECTFHGSALSVFSWLAPAKLATPAPAAASEAAE